MTSSKTAAIMYVVVGLYGLGCLFIPANPHIQPRMLVLADVILFFMVVFCGVAAWMCWRRG